MHYFSSQNWVTRGRCEVRMCFKNNLTDINGQARKSHIPCPGRTLGQHKCPIPNSGDHFSDGTWYTTQVHRCYFEYTSIVMYRGTWAKRRSDKDINGWFGTLKKNHKTSRPELSINSCEGWNHPAKREWIERRGQDRPWNRQISRPTYQDDDWGLIHVRWTFSLH